MWFCRLDCHTHTHTHTHTDSTKHNDVIYNQTINERLNREEQHQQRLITTKVDVSQHSLQTQTERNRKPRLAHQPTADRQSGTNRFRTGTTSQVCQKTTVVCSPARPPAATEARRLTSSCPTTTSSRRDSRLEGTIALCCSRRISFKARVRRCIH